MKKFVCMLSLVALALLAVPQTQAAEAKVDTRKAKARAAKYGEVMNFGRAPVYVGVDFETFAELIVAFEKDNGMKVSDKKELGLLFSTYDIERDGKLRAEELRLTFDPEYVEAMKKKKKKKGGGGGDDLPPCISGTCGCDGGLGGFDQPLEVQGMEMPMPQPGPGPETEWCGGPCHCHCNTHTCGQNGT